MDPSTKDSMSQLDELLGASNQAWLLGAGISRDAGIPLMGPLTEQVFKRASDDGEENDKAVLDQIKSQLTEGCHIEHILSQIGDLRAIAERSRIKTVDFGTVAFTLDELDHFHQRILTWIAETVRWGYCPKSGGQEEMIGTRDLPIVSVKDHSEFVASLFTERQKGLSERRRAVKLFTINYDTLLEDALALSCLPYWDGFTGGAVAFRNYRFGEKEPGPEYRAHVVKLHGSIDWHLCEEGKVWRVRDGDNYPTKSSRVLIYPQSTKYLATQRDPFAAQFDLLRRSLASTDENVFATCGYSFGDEHINQEIEMSMERPGNKTTILAFSQHLNPTLKKWRNSSWKKRLYIISEAGLYVGDEGPHAVPAEGKKLDWWTFQGVIKILSNGPEASIL
ncbi:MAG: SIR2 family protein [Akkermansiaceae bacterium]|jgi:hypothetical protein|nr:SIR2 family protein [Luteolibacter sp.]